ncbi:D-alanyl-D-alanine carboxypeptidase family protein [Oceanirhabdus seepicola]|uniref:D-alanyl-D-alanine carboxypeptidase family protein n=1 Tax=Oceanirhabdus seepicola TaxID=2828781 RepID=A0A9J6NW55_9CLOT|nr:D-alanyl-D-alanine carboxypeptidase family protein [Oceanirhabdus seepicola]MCM1988292.1 D-alanyl-D-alanine carboxypeptidase family protein [Oceanirhabdus seepicola]
MKKLNVKGKILSIALVILLISSLPFANKVEAITKCDVKPNKSEGKKDIILEIIKNISQDTEKDSSDNIDTEVEVEDEFKDEEHEVYIVQSGDTLFKISVKYNIDIRKLKEINDLTSDTIYIGQALTIITDANGLNDKIIVSNPDHILALVNKKNKLPSDYIPHNLVVPNVPFPFKSYHSKKLMRKEAAQALENLFKKAEEDNIKIYALSGYRSYTRQESIFASNVKKNGLEKANQFSAKPGESEHQTGLAMDLTSPSVNNVLTQRFGQTMEGKWVKANAYKFGFIIRYPKGKEHITGYQYEPWHLRFVGKEAAEEIFNKNITLEEYLGEI